MGLSEQLAGSFFIIIFATKYISSTDNACKSSHTKDLKFSIYFIFPFTNQIE